MQWDCFLKQQFANDSLDEGGELDPSDDHGYWSLDVLANKRLAGWIRKNLATLASPSLPPTCRKEVVVVSCHILCSLTSVYFIGNGVVFFVTWGVQAMKNRRRE